MLLFVYGTLKKGHRNHHYLEDQEFLGNFDTESHYRMFDNGSFPMLILSSSEGYSVSGELYDVDEDLIEEIDLHEVLYDRQLIELIDFDDEPVYAYIYRGGVSPHEECYGIWG